MAGWQVCYFYWGSHPTGVVLSDVWCMCHFEGKVYLFPPTSYHKRYLTRWHMGPFNWMEGERRVAAWQVGTSTGSVTLQVWFCLMYACPWLCVRAAVNHGG